MILRPYQENIVDKTRKSLISGKKAPLIVSPTGSGKTVMFSYYASRAVAKGKTVFILAHRVELLEQISETLQKFNVDHGFIAPGYPKQYHKKVQVASVFSLVRKLGKVPTPDLLIIDEAHHACSGSTWGKISQFYKTFTIGVTATPCRLSGEPLNDIFDDMILGPSVADLIKIEALCDYKVFAPSSIDMSQVKTVMGDYDRKQTNQIMDRATITGDIINEYKKKSLGKRAAFYGCSVQHAEHAAMQFRASGIAAASIDGEMDKYNRKRILDDFRSGVLKVVTNFGIITEGFDLPAIETVILARPTKSLSLYLQMVGRALRPLPGKPYALILDHVDAIRNHGLPDEEREWSLTGSMKKKAEEGKVRVRVCDMCYAVMPVYAELCTFCGYVFQKQVREVPEVEGDLKELDKEAIRKERLKKIIQRENREARNVEALVLLGKARGYKHPERWAEHYFKQREQYRKMRGMR